LQGFDHPVSLISMALPTLAPSSIPERYNASLLLDENLDAARGSKVAIHCGDEQVTYAELLARACRFASLLTEIGVGRGERVLVSLDDCPWLPAVFLGTMRAGAVPIPINPFYRDEQEIGYFLDDSDAQAVVTGGACAEAVLPATRNRVDSARVFCTDGGRDDAADLLSSTAGLSADVSPADTHRDDPAFWLYSSGSTGRPKGVVHLQHDMRYTCETYARHVLGIEESDTTFSTTKLFHAYGLGNNLSFPYFAGAATVLLNGRATPEAVLATVARFRPTLFFSAPTLYNALLRADDGSADFSSVRLCISAAEPLPAEIWTRWNKRHDAVILDGIGSTEMLHIYCSNTAEDVTPGSSGKPVPSYELKLAEDGEEIVGPGVGDLYVRGGSALAEYWNQLERTQESLRDGWFYTRDRYRRDDDGRYWYEGRTDDMFKVNGLWVSPATVEAALLEHPAVVESAVVATTVDGLQRGKAFVTLADGAGVGEAELHEFCSAQLHRYEVPDVYVFVDELPKTVTGKIQRFLLRDD
jgi:benzoate-CoA ligase family protein